jgi:hypothetical protein
MPIFGRHINKTKAIPLVAKRVIEFSNARNIRDTALNSAERAMSESLLDGFSMIRPEEFEKLVNNIYYTGYEKEVERAFAVIESELASELHKQLVESAKAEAKELSQQFISALTKAELPTPAEITMAFSFNAQSPEALKWARDESSKLVTNMKKDQLAMVRRVVGQSFGAGDTRAGTSKNLRAILSQVSPGTDAGKLMARTLGVNANGLTVRYEQALFNRATQVANTLTAQGIEGTKALEKIKTDTNKYAEKLRRQRARTIARTETMMAYNEGKQQAWNQAADRGLINKQTARKVWVTGPMDVCTICAPLNGQNQPINKPFSIKRMTPPAHPNCRCTMVLNASPKGRPTQGLGTGTPGDPYRVSVPDVPNLDDFPALPNVDAGDVVSAPRPTTPTEGFSVERRVVSGEDIEFHVHSDGRVQVPGTDIERDPTGRWFRNDKNGVREEFIPSRNSAAGKIERGVKGGVPTPPKPVVPEPTPPIVPEPVVVVPEPPVKPSLLDRQEFDRDGKVPAFRINTDGTIQLPDTYHNGSPIRRTADGKWERIAEPNGNYYTEFTPSQNSAAGQLERHLKRNKFKPGEEFKPTGVRPPKPVAPEPKPVVPEPTPTGASPTAGPLSGARPDLVVDIEDLRDDIALMSKSGARSRSTSDWIGWDEHPNDTAAMDAIDKAGGRVLAKIEQEVRRLDPTAQDDIRAIDKLIDEAKYELDKLALNMTSEYRKAWTSILDRITSDAVSHRTKALMSYVDLPAQDEIANTLLVFDKKSRQALLDAIVEEGDTSAGRLLAQLLRVDYFGGEKTWARIIDDLAGVGDIRLSSTRFDEFAKVPELNEAIERWRQAMDARGKVNDKVLQLRAEKGKIAKRVVDMHNAVLKDVLRASRPRYGQPRASIASYFRDVKLPTGVKKKDWTDAIEELDGMLPAEWVEDTITQTRGSGWTLKFTKRGYNSSRERTIALSGDKTNSGKGIRGWRSTLAHEFQHSVQDVRGVTNSEYLIINRLGKKRGLTSSSKPKTITKGEVGWDLGINDLYTGRLYTWGSTEVTTRGVERLFYEGWAGMRKNGDEYIRYLLGILVGL